MGFALQRWTAAVRKRVTHELRLQAGSCRSARDVHQHDTSWLCGGMAWQKECVLEGFVSCAHAGGVVPGVGSLMFALMADAGLLQTLFELLYTLDCQRTQPLTGSYATMRAEQYFESTEVCPEPGFYVDNFTSRTHTHCCKVMMSTSTPLPCQC
jgi:hypothetical protein